RPEDLLTYECDGYTLERATPDAVVHVTGAEQVQKIVGLCAREGIPFYPRGLGTGLSGGCTPICGSAPADAGAEDPDSLSIVIALNRMDRILEIDLRNRIAVVEPGVINLALTEAVQDDGYFFAPDPASQQACSIGGNIAENSGGPHCLKYGVTANHVLGVEMVLPNGDLVQLGGKAEDAPGYDLVRLVIGSEGTLGIVTKAVVRLLRAPQGVRTMLAIFDSVRDASQSVSDIIAAGMIPVALEMMDRLIVGAVEAAYGFGFPLDAEAVLIVELDGIDAGLDDALARARSTCERNGAREVRMAGTDEERLLLWTSRKRAFGAVGRLSPSFCTQDGTVPRTRLPEMLERVAAIGERYGVRIANVFHAGDGNLHPLVLFDDRDEEQVRKVPQIGGEILEACVELGGAITGEHGIGSEKIEHMPLVFDDTALRAMRGLKRIFDPDGICNPGKILPAEVGPARA
ncbi:MAG: FAD-linked oxidase C-terminal domain-containing protein, partial [Armatimonadota bacterium]